LSAHPSDIGRLEIGHRQRRLESPFVVVAEPRTKHQPRAQNRRVVFRVGELGGVFEGPLIILEGVGAVTQLLLEQTEIEVAPPMTGSLFQASPVGLSCVVEFVLRVLGKTQAKPRLIEIGVEIKSPFVKLQRVLGEAFVEHHGAKIDKLGSGELITLGPLPIVADCLVTRVVGRKPPHKGGFVSPSHHHGEGANNADDHTKHSNPSPHSDSLHSTSH